MPNSFFTQKEVNLLSKWSMVPYDKKNPAHHEIRELLKEGVWEKTKKWAEEVALATNLESFCWRTTMDRGWIPNPEGKGPSLRRPHFKGYSWAQVYRKGEREKGICFVFAVSGDDKALEFKIDKRWSGTQKLSQEQRDLFDKYLGKDHPARMQRIPFDEWKIMEWSEILTRSIKFTKRYLPLYDSLVKYVWEDKFEASQAQNQLILRKTPVIGTKKDLAIGKFEGKKIDFEKLDREAKAVGKAGELLAIEYEKHHLIENGRADLAIMVNDCMDGEGYDIKSFHIDGTDKFIEVKTTTGGKSEKFFLTRNERNFYLQNPENYFLYRIYNFSKNDNAGEFFIISGNLDSKIHREPQRFLCWI